MSCWSFLVFLLYCPHYGHFTCICNIFPSFWSCVKSFMALPTAHTSKNQPLCAFFSPFDWTPKGDLQKQIFVVMNHHLSVHTLLVMLNSSLVWGQSSSCIWFTNMYCRCQWLDYEAEFKIFCIQHVLMLHEILQLCQRKTLNICHNFACSHRYLVTLIVNAYYKLNLCG